MEIVRDDNSSGGSNEECQIFKDTFLGRGSSDTIANINSQPGQSTNTNVAMSGDHLSLLSYKEVLLKNLSNACETSKGRSEGDGNSKRMKSSLAIRNYGKTRLEIIQKEPASTLSRLKSKSSSHNDTLRVVEYSMFNVPSSSKNSVISGTAEEPNIYLLEDIDNNGGKIFSQERNGCKDLLAIKQVTSPVSQESCATKAIVLVDNSNSKSSRKEKQEDDELYGSVSLKDVRDQLMDQVTKFMEAQGWHIEVRQRECRTYKEKVYISDSGKRVREFPKLWRLLGRSFSVNDSHAHAVVDNNKCWTDLSHFCSDLSNTLVRTGPMITPTAPAIGFTILWNILDPFVNILFIDRKIGTLRKGTAVQALRSIPYNAIVKNNGDLCFDLDAVAKKKSESKGKIEPPLSSIASDKGLVLWEENCVNRNENVDSGRNLNIGEQSKSRKRKNEKSGSLVDFTQGDTKHFKSAKQHGNSETIVFERATGVEDSLFRSSLYDVHSDFINQWGSQHGPSEGIKDHIAAETSYSYQSNNYKMLIDFSSHSILHPSEISLGGKEILVCSDGSPSPSMIFETQNESWEESENKLNSLHNVAVSWKEQEDVTNHHLVSAGLVLNRAGALKEGNSVGPSKQVGGQTADDDLLLSIIKKKKKRYGSGSHSKVGTDSNLKVRNTKRKARGRGRSRSLQPRSKDKDWEQLESGKCISLGTRTPLSWLIDCGVAHLDETIIYQSNKVVKKGFLTKDGIICYCCNALFSVSKFSLHAGAKSPEASANLFMECGRTYESCQLQAWSAEYLKRKMHKKPSREEDDESDDICGLCGDGGDLICCDNCPATFHPNCLSTQGIPEGSWYCSSCICRICGEFSGPTLVEGMKCAQCEHKYHRGCLIDNTMVPVGTDEGYWFCSEICHKINSGICSRLGVEVPVANGYSATLLKCIHDDDDDEKSHSPRPSALKAECNPKLAVALTIMEECFASMVDFRTGIDMIPHMVYNFGSNFPRLDFLGFYTVILEKDDVVLCVASLRIHGSSIAEIPLVATCSKYRRKGMCRLLMGAIEEMLTAHNIDTIVMAAVPELVPTWVNGFGFHPIDADEKEGFKTLNLVVLPGTDLLKKSLSKNDPPTQTQFAAQQSCRSPSP